MKSNLVLRVAGPLFASLAIAVTTGGCAVIAVADAVVTVGATAVKVGAKTVGAAVDIVTPNSHKDNE